MKTNAKSCQVYQKVTRFYFISFVNREIELRENLVGTGFINPPDEKSEFNNRITVVGKLQNQSILIILIYRWNCFRKWFWCREIVI